MEGQGNCFWFFPDTHATMCSQEEHRVSNLMPCFWILTFIAFISFCISRLLREKAASRSPRRPESLSDTRASYMLPQHPLDFLLC